MEHKDKIRNLLNDSNVAVNFWTTIHGLHLKNYLITYKKLNSEAMQKLSFENVASYWKEYVSDLSRNAIPPDPQPVNYVDLNKISFDTIKMNLTTIRFINSPQYNPKTVVDLSSIKMQTWEYNFKTFSIRLGAKLT